MNPIQTLTISKYIKKVQMSKKRRKKYYRRQKGKWKPRDLPPTYQDKINVGDWSVDKKGYLRIEDGTKKVANPQAAGTPRYESLSGNSFMAGFNSYHIRRKLTGELKKFVKDQLRPFNPSEIPLIITWDFYTTTGKVDWDMDNMFFYWKYLQDVLVNENILPNDTIQYITFPPSGRLRPVKKWSDRKFVFKFYTDSNKELITHFKQEGLLL